MVDRGVFCPYCFETLNFVQYHFAHLTIDYSADACNNLYFHKLICVSVKFFLNGPLGCQNLFNNSIFFRSINN